MKIKEITLKNYGKYKDREKPLTFQSGINLVFGHNEAGKSTLFDGIMTLLYGFKPANREAHPYLGWGENKIELSGVFEDQQGPFTVERRLMSSPSGQLLRDDKTLKINNKALDQVQDISKQAFTSIYALSLQDLVKMQDAPWSEVEDRLILNYGVDSIKAPREVIMEIEDEMKSLYNPRGQAKNTKVKLLEKAIKDLKVKRREILDIQESVLDKEDALKEIEVVLKELLKEEATLESQLQWWEKHQSVIDLSMQLEGSKEEGTSLKSLLGKPPLKVMSYPELAIELEKLEEKKKTLENEVKSIEAKLQVLSNEESKCVQEEETIEAFLKAYQVYEQDKALHLQNKSFLDDKRKQLSQEVSDIVTQPTAHQLESFSTLNLMTLEGHIEEIIRLRKDIESLRQDILMKAKEDKGSGKFQAMGLILIGATAFAIGTYLQQSFVNYGATLLLSYGAYKLLNTKKSEDEEDIKVFEEKIAFNQKKMEERRLKVQGILAFMTVADEDLVDNGHRLISLLKLAKDKSKDLLNAEAAFSKTEEDLNEVLRELNQTYQSFEFEDQAINTEKLKGLLSLGLKKQQHNERIRVEARTKNEQLLLVKENYSKLGTQVETLKAYLIAIGQGDIHTGLNLLKRLEKINEKIAFLEEQLLSKDPGKVMQKGLEKLSENQLDGESAKEKQVKLREVRESVEALKLKKRTLVTERDHQLKEVDLFDTESQLLALEEELEEAKEHYDQLLLFKRALIAYDQEYRENHQPDIHRRTAAYFSQITKGKYLKVYNDESFSKTGLFLRQADEDRDVDVALSQGGRDQLYLALRLALADELDKEKSPLPIFLDELFVNWDIERLQEGIELLKELSKNRQIILFTCHEWLLEKMKNELSPHIIMLDA